MKSGETLIAFGLLAAMAGWLGWQRHGINAQKESNDRLRTQLKVDHYATDSPASSTGGQEPASRLPGGSWKAFLATHPRSESEGNSLWQFHLQKALLTMSDADLLNAFHQVESSGAELTPRLEALSGIVTTLSYHDPKAAADLYKSKVMAGNEFNLALVLRRWGQKDPEAVTKWLDRYRADKEAGPKSSLLFDPGVLTLEGMIMPLLPAQEAISRFRSLNEQAKESFFSSYALPWKSSEDQQASANYARSEEGSKIAPSIFADSARNITAQSGLEGVASYMNQISATAEERETIVRQATLASLPPELGQDDDSARIQKSLSWLTDNLPPGSNDALAETLAYESPQWGFAETAGIAARYADQTGDDSILIHFIDKQPKGIDPEMALKIISQVKDPDERTRLSSRYGKAANKP